MGLYIYENPETGEVKEVFQTMKEPHIYEENGKKWRRLFVSPQAGIDTQIDPFSSKEFVSKTSSKRETYGDILDRSKEMSEKRASKDGVDIQKQKYMEQWSKERNGRKFPTWTLK